MAGEHLEVIDADSALDVEVCDQLAGEWHRGGETLPERAAGRPVEPGDGAVPPPRAGRRTGRRSTRSRSGRCVVAPLRGGPAPRARAPRAAPHNATRRVCPRPAPRTTRPSHTARSGPPPAAVHGPLGGIVLGFGFRSRIRPAGCAPSDPTSRAGPRFVCWSAAGLRTAPPTVSGSPPARPVADGSVAVPHRPRRARHPPPAACACPAPACPDAQRDALRREPVVHGEVAQLLIVDAHCGTGCATRC